MYLYKYTIYTELTTIIVHTHMYIYEYIVHLYIQHIISSHRIKPF